MVYTQNQSNFVMFIQKLILKSYKSHAKINSFCNISVLKTGSNGNEEIKNQEFLHVDKDVL